MMFRWQKICNLQKCFFPLLLLMLTATAVLIYYLAYLGIDVNPDTAGYLIVVERIHIRLSWIVDAVRLPGYPLFILLIYALAGYGNLAAVSVAQAALFVVMTLEIYTITLLVFRRAWLAFVVALLIGTNPVLIAYIKPIMSEALAAFWATTLALLVVLFIRGRRLLLLWLITLCMGLLIFTRPEWLYLPIPLFLYLLIVAQRGKKLATAHLLRYAAAVALSLVLIYGLVGTYIVINASQNHYPGFLATENANFLGKILQYHMQDESEDKATSRALDGCIAATHDLNPYRVVPCMPESFKKNFALAGGAFARSILLHHPGEFLFKSTPLFFSSFTDLVHADEYYHDKSAPNAFQAPVQWLKMFYLPLYQLNGLFPLCALAWIALLCWRRMHRELILSMVAMIVLVAYANAIAALGTNTSAETVRLHVVFDPLLDLIIFASLIALGVRVYRRCRPSGKVQKPS